jgi:hypothetical protein
MDSIKEVSPYYRIILIEAYHVLILSVTLLQIEWPLFGYSINKD